MKLLIIGPDSLTCQDTIKSAIKFHKLQKKVKEIVSPGDKPFYETVGKIFGNSEIKLNVFKPDWNDITRAGAELRKNKWGKQYNRLAAFHRDDDMLDYIENNNGAVLLIVGQYPWKKWKEKIEADYTSLSYMEYDPVGDEPERKYLYEL